MERFIPLSLGEKGLHFLGLSAERYSSPIKPRAGERVRFWHGSPSHTGRFKYSQDIIIPDPRVKPLPIYAPSDCVVVKLEQNNDIWGQIEKFARFNNFLLLQTFMNGEPINEFVEIIHFLKGSCPFKVGSKIDRNTQLAITGPSGWMTDVRHVHVMVGRELNHVSGNLRSLKIRWINS